MIETQVGWKNEKIFPKSTFQVLSRKGVKSRTFHLFMENEHYHPSPQIWGYCGFDRENHLSSNSGVSSMENLKSTSD
jgi:hypothetical protein